MTHIRSVIALTGFLLVAAFSHSAANAQPPSAEKSSLGASADAFKALEQEMTQAEEDYYKALDALTDKQGNITIGGNTKLPTDKRADILQKMDALANANAGKPEGPALAVKTFQWAVSVDPEKALPRFEKLVAQFPNEPTMTEALDAAAFAASVAESQDKWLSAIEKLEKSTKIDATKAAGLYIEGQVQMSSKKMSDAKASFEKVAKLTKDEELAKKAKSYIYEIEHLQVGMEAPDFTTKTLDGRDISLKSLRGKVVLLDFWASWCGPCVGEIPHLTSAYTQLKDANKPFEILAVSVDDDRRALESIIKERKPPGIQTWDSKEGDNPLALQYNVRGLPTWYLIDQKGIIRLRDPEGEQLVASVNAVLEGKTPPEPGAPGKNPPEAGAPNPTAP